MNESHVVVHRLPEATMTRKCGWITAMKDHTYVCLIMLAVQAVACRERSVLIIILIPCTVQTGFLYHQAALFMVQQERLDEVVKELSGWKYEEELAAYSHEKTEAAEGVSVT